MFSPGPFSVHALVAYKIALDLPSTLILLAAIHSKAGYLLTGDGRHFGHLYGKRIEGVRVLRPAAYFERRRHR